MPLKSIDVAAPAATTKKSDVPVVNVQGTKVSRLNEISTELKELQAEEKDLKKQVEKQALGKLFDRNLADPHNVSDSIKLSDENDQVVRVSFTSRYKQADGEAADAILTELGKDINDYAIQTTTAQFNAKVFVQDDEFQPEVYNAFQQAIADATATLIAEGKLPVGTASPLTSKVVVMPKPSFHSKRWSEFPTVDEQQQVTKALPNTVQVVPNAKL